MKTLLWSRNFILLSTTCNETKTYLLVGMWKGHHFLMAVIRRRYLFCLKWYIKGYGVGPRGGASPYKKVFRSPLPLVKVSLICMRISNNYILMWNNCILMWNAWNSIYFIYLGALPLPIFASHGLEETRVSTYFFVIKLNYSHLSTLCFALFWLKAESAFIKSWYPGVLFES